MNLTQEQFETLCANYMDFYIDNLNNQEKEEILFNLLFDDLLEHSPAQVLSEIRNGFSEEVLSNLLESVTV